MMFCNDRAEALRLKDAARRRGDALLRELSHYIRTPGVIGIEIRLELYPFTGWAVEADLTFDGDVVRSYESFELLEIDILHLQLAVLAKNKNRIK
jgi:hypothetical protein